MAVVVGSAVLGAKRAAMPHFAMTTTSLRKWSRNTEKGTAYPVRDSSFRRGFLLGCHKEVASVWAIPSRWAISLPSVVHDGTGAFRSANQMPGRRTGSSMCREIVTDANASYWFSFRGDLYHNPDGQRRTGRNGQRGVAASGGPRPTGGFARPWTRTSRAAHRSCCRRTRSWPRSSAACAFR